MLGGAALSNLSFADVSHSQDVTRSHGRRMIMTRNFQDGQTVSLMESDCPFSGLAWFPLPSLLLSLYTLHALYLSRSFLIPIRRTISLQNDVHRTQRRFSIPALRKVMGDREWA